MNRRMVLISLIGAALAGLPEPSDAARPRKKGSARQRRVRGGSNVYSPREPASGNDGCPCNGGKVCVGPRGGRYCITASGKKRYGV